MRVSLDKVPQSHWVHVADVTAVGAALPDFSLIVPVGYWQRSIYLHFATDGVSQNGTLIGEIRFLLNGQLITSEPLANKQVNNIPARMFLSSLTAAGPEFIKYQLANGGAEVDMFPHEFFIECDEIQVNWKTATGVGGARGQYFLGCLSKRQW
jgi:hypothetical protein